MSDKVKLILAVFILIYSAGVSEADVVENSLKINLIKYDPYPANPDTDFSI